MREMRSHDSNLNAPIMTEASDKQLANPELHHHWRCVWMRSAGTGECLLTFQEVNACRTYVTEVIW